MSIVKIVDPVDISQPFGFSPQGQTIFAPKQRVRPARNRFPGVPFAHTIMYKASSAKNFFEFVNKVISQLAFLRAIGSAVPLLGFHIVYRYKSGFPSHGEAHIPVLQFLFHCMAKCNYFGPLRFRIRLGYTRVFVDAFNQVAEMKSSMARFQATRNGCGASRIWRTGQRNMASFGQEPRGRIQSDPTRARNVYFCPGMQVGKIFQGTRRTIQCFLIGFELNQITRHKPGGQTKMTQRLNQHPTRIPARAQGFA